MNKVVLNQLIFELTRRCNMRCAHCLRGDAEDVDIHNWDIDNILDQTEAIGRLAFTGGEPLLNLSAMQYIVNGITQRGIPIMRFQTVTNGSIYDESFITIVKRISQIINLTQQHGYGSSEREPWRVRIGVSLDRYHAEPEKCKKNYIRYKNSLRGYAEVLQVRHGNAPKNEGRGKMLPNTIDFSTTVSSYVLQQIEVLSSDIKPRCKFYDTYFLSRPDQKIVCCGLYINAHGQVLPSLACDSDFKHRGIVLCDSWEDIWTSILKYNNAEGQLSCLECDNYRLEASILRSDEQADRETALMTARDAQDEPSCEPISLSNIEKYQKIMDSATTLDAYEEIEKAALAKDYLILSA